MSIWNDWRKNYYLTTSSEHLKFYNWLEKEYPSQKHFTPSYWALFFEAHKPKTIVEVGGWKGELASHFIPHSNIDSWLNLEVCSQAIEKGLRREEYCAKLMDDFWWYKEPFEISADALISSHTIEHLHDHDFDLFAKNVCNNFDLVAFEAPISLDGDSWDNYVGTHILTIGWRGVDAIMHGLGFATLLELEFFRVYKRANK